MRILVLGGTRFIGRAIVEDLVASGHGVAVVHRGETEPAGLPDVLHVHTDRSRLEDVANDLAGFRPDAAIDCLAMTRSDADTALAALGHLPGEPRLLVLSSCDVYRAYGSVQANTVTDAVPVDETAPVREARYPYRGQLPGLDDYEKLDVEDAYRARGATVIRLPMVYGEHDGQRREEFVLRRVRARRSRIPFGPGTWLTARGHSAEMARGVRLALECEAAASLVLNLAESPTASIGLWAGQILDAAGSNATLVRVPTRALPPDLELTGSIAQHLLVDASRAAQVLGWVHAEPVATLARSVEWHLAHPPPAPDPGFEADDAALAEALG